MSLEEAKVAAPVMGPKGTAEHREFVGAIEHHDAGQASAIMRAHLQCTADRVAPHAILC
ncbi:hypothetical protein ACFLIM_13790 [Nonomuraea sp. M3C6]|uniref:FCD domain-containing protein n=1 Tax=Nonomuraea marmarensis TaxID=3351344 RepID=A0ABW7AD74_9ACTN